MSPGETARGTEGWEHVSESSFPRRWVSRGTPCRRQVIGTVSSRRPAPRLSEDRWTDVPVTQPKRGGEGGEGRVNMGRGLIKVPSTCQSSSNSHSSWDSRGCQVRAQEAGAVAMWAWPPARPAPPVPGLL